MTPVGILARLCRAALLDENAGQPVPHSAALPSLALQHGVYSLIATRLLPHIEERDRADASHRQRYLRCQALDRVRELLNVHALLTDESIPVLAIKGPALSAQLYDDPTWRISGDLDFMIEYENASRAVNALIRAGFTHPSETIQNLEVRRTFDHEVGVFSPGGTLIELQWAWAQPHFSVHAPIEASFESAVPVRLGAMTVSTLAPAHLIPYLAMHGAKHGWSRLDLCCDFARATTVFAHQLDDAREVAADAGLLGVLAVAQVLIRDLLGVEPVPAIADSKQREIAATYRNSLLHGVRNDAMGLFLASREHLFDRVRALARLTFAPTPTDLAWVRLPAKLRSLYYVVRPVRISVRSLQRSAPRI